MSRMRRVHVPDSIYFALLRAEPGQSICANDAEYRHLRQLIGRSVQRCHSQLHAYFCCSEEVRLVIEVTDVPLGKCMQRISTWQSRYVHRRRRESGHLFVERYRAVRLPRRALLPALVRCIHRSPGEFGLTQDWAQYPWSSHQAYVSGSKMRGLRTGTTLRLLTKERGRRREAYRRFMEGKEDIDAGPEDLRPPFGNDGTAEQWFAWCLSQQAGQKRITLDEVIDGVTRVFGIDRGALLSRSRDQHLTLARAVLTHYVMRHGVATLVDVERSLGRSRSTLYAGIKRYEALWPTIFGPEMFALVERACAANHQALQEWKQSQSERPANGVDARPTRVKR